MSKKPPAPAPAPSERCAKCDALLAELRRALAGAVLMGATPDGSFVKSFDYLLGKK